MAETNETQGDSVRPIAFNTPVESTQSSGCTNVTVNSTNDVKIK